MAAVSAIGPIGKISEITLTPHWLGFAGKPRDFVVATIPPRS
jgi:hypothetical protein